MESRYRQTSQKVEIIAMFAMFANVQSDQKCSLQRAFFAPCSFAVCSSCSSASTLKKPLHEILNLPQNRKFKISVLTSFTPRSFARRGRNEKVQFGQKKRKSILRQIQYFVKRFFSVSMQTSTTNTTQKSTVRKTLSEASIFDLIARLQTLQILQLFSPFDSSDDMSA